MADVQFPFKVADVELHRVVSCFEKRHDREDIEKEYGTGDPPRMTDQEYVDWGIRALVADRLWHHEKRKFGDAAVPAPDILQVSEGVSP